MRTRLISIVTLASLGALALAAPAHATFPGANGKIAFWACSPDCSSDGENLYTINPDGTERTRLTNDAQGVVNRNPAWSPDGSKIAFDSNRAGPGVLENDVYVINADGSGLTRLTTQTGDWPAWSPDGTRIVFHSYRNSQGIYLMNADGSDQHYLDAGGFPNWSPDGTKIAYASNAGCCQLNLYRINPDGSGKTRLTIDPDPQEHPNWSPDGRHITFIEAVGGYPPFNWHIYVMNADGSNPTDITNSPGWYRPVWSPDGKKILSNGSFRDPSCCTQTGSLGVPFTSDWQRIPVANFGHPQTASQLSVSLVPLFRQCGTGGSPANSDHAPPLAVGSCSPPQPSSPVARVGPISQGSAQLTVVPGDADATNGDQADVTIVVHLTDVVTTTGAEYNPNPLGPDLTEITRLRLTDEANGYGGTPATAGDLDFSVPVDCVPTVGLEGASCDAVTTADAVIPGAIQEARKTVAQVFRVRLYDAGANGSPENGLGDDKIFAHQGVFVP